MTIQEAIKSGKQFKRRKWGIWLFRDDDEVCTIDIRQSTVIFILRIVDLLADDWEVKES